MMVMSIFWHSVLNIMILEALMNYIQDYGDYSLMLCHIYFHFGDSKKWNPNTFNLNFSSFTYVFHIYDVLCLMVEPSNLWHALAMRHQQKHLAGEWEQYEVYDLYGSPLVPYAANISLPRVIYCPRE